MEKPLQDIHCVFGSQKHRNDYQLGKKQPKMMRKKQNFQFFFKYYRVHLAENNEVRYVQFSFKKDKGEFNKTSIIMMNKIMMKK